MSLFNMIDVLFNVVKCESICAISGERMQQWFRALGGYGLVMRLHHVFERADAGGAFGLFTACAGRVDFRNAAFFTAVAHMLNGVFIAERVAKA